MEKINDTTLTIIVPIYNAEKRLNICLSSLSQQTYKNIRVILVDDGSTDGSSLICNSFCKKDSRFSYIKSENHGVSYARNLGIKLTNTEYLTFCDADDYVDSTAYEEAMNSMLQKKVDCLCFEYKTINANDSSITNSQFNDTVYNKDDIKAEILFPTLGFDDSNLSKLDITYPVWNKIFKKSILEKYKISFNEQRKTTEDWQFSLDYFCKIKTIYFLKRVLYYYYHCDINTLSRTKYIENSFDIVVGDRIRYIKEIPSFPWNSKLSQLKFKNRWLEFALYYFNNDLENIRDKLKHMFTVYTEMELYNYASNLSIHRKLDLCSKKGKQKRFIRTLLFYSYLDKIKTKLHIKHLKHILHL